MSLRSVRKRVRMALLALALIALMALTAGARMEGASAHQVGQGFQCHGTAYSGNWKMVYVTFANGGTGHHYHQYYHYYWNGSYYQYMHDEWVDIVEYC